MSIKLRQYEPLLITLFKVSDGFIGVFLFWFVASWGKIGKYKTEASLVLFFIILANFSYTGLYQSWRMSSLQEEFKKLIQSCLIVYFILFIIIYFLKVSSFFPYSVILSWMLIWPAILLVQRASVRSLLRYYRKWGRNIKQAVIAGETGIGKRL